MARKDAPFFSVVMPAYNAATTLAGAIGDVVGQTFASWELIVVDDGSTDATGRVADAWAARDGRVRVVRKEKNEGLAAARNTGMAEARGRYLWMPDADDSFAPDLLELAWREVAAMAGLDEGRADEAGALTDADLADAPDAVLFGYVEDYVDERGTFLYSHEVPATPGRYRDPAAWHGLVAGLEQATLYGYAWNKVWRLDHVRAAGVAYEDVRLIEDVLFSVAFFEDARGLAVCGAMPYRYLKREGRSLTNANEYGASEYWRLHERRVATLCGQLARWGVLDGEARAVMGSLYARFVVSTLERSYQSVELWSRRHRLAWLDRLFSSALFCELIPHARARDSRVLATAIRLLQSRDARACALLGRACHVARTRSYRLFTAVRSGR